MHIVSSCTRRAGVRVGALAFVVFIYLPGVTQAAPPEDEPQDSKAIAVEDTADHGSWTQGRHAEPWLLPTSLDDENSAEAEAASQPVADALDGILEQITRLLDPLLGQLGLADGTGTPKPGAELYEPVPSERRIALYENDEVRKFMRIYLDSHRQAFAAGLDRAGRFVPMMQHIFAQEGLPLDLVYLAIVESNLNPRALSPKRATGLWQFMWATARHFGLRVEPWYDERLDPVLSTRAAARMLRYLHDKFGNWELALAAYNAGEGRVFQAIRASEEIGQERDFWNLALPTETRRYVPSFIAVALIYNDLERFGFEPLPPEAYLDYEIVESEFHTTLEEIARRIGYPAEVLRDLNPAWKQGLIPPAHAGKVLLRLPPGGKLRLRQAMAAAPLAAPQIARHRVSRGETLTVISKRYGVPIQVLLSVNAIPNRHFLRRGQMLLIPLNHAAKDSGSAHQI